MRRKVTKDGRDVITLSNVLHKGFIFATTTELGSLMRAVNEQTKFFKKLNTKRIKNKLKPIYRFYVHLSPDVTFMVRIK